MGNSLEELIKIPRLNYKHTLLSSPQIPVEPLLSKHARMEILRRISIQQMAFKLIAENNSRRKLNIDINDTKKN